MMLWVLSSYVIPFLDISSRGYLHSPAVRPSLSLPNPPTRPPI